ncbi:MAG: SH3 domain-containing protein [Reichenbachiella sp.]|uniref:SH3 domain-containing protein n=1 Tax=Reichenbachiella sp. TaxID=2184521 RepID=UPI003263F68B
MTKNILSTLFTASFFFLMSCSSNTENSTTAATEDASVEEVTEPLTSPAVCIWDKIVVRATPAKDGKYVTRLSVGESLTYLGKDSTVDEKTYAYVLLNDGKEGWAISDFIVNNAKPAVVVTDINMYSRPDLLTKTEKVFKMMDIVSSIEVQEDWMKIKGRRSGAKWMDEGWVKSENISFEAVDIAGAKFALEALAIEDEDKRREALNDIINNSDLSGSKFILELETTLMEMEGIGEEDVEAELEDVAIEEESTDSIN